MTNWPTDAQLRQTFPNFMDLMDTVRKRQGAAYTIRIYCADEQEPFRAEVDEHPALTAFGQELDEVLENVAKGIDSLE